MDKKNGFSYSYSAKEQEELKAIKSKYLPGNEGEDKLARLRCLDGSVRRVATVAALIHGVIGSLVMGVGMSFIMTELGSIMSMSHELAIAVGIPVGIFGMALVALAYPVYILTAKARRRQVAPEILALIDELTK